MGCRAAEYFSRAGHHATLHGIASQLRPVGTGAGGLGADNLVKDRTFVVYGSSAYVDIAGIVYRRTGPGGNRQFGLRDYRAIQRRQFQQQLPAPVGDIDIAQIVDGRHAAVAGIAARDKLPSQGAIGRIELEHFVGCPVISVSLFVQDASQAVIACIGRYLNFPYRSRDGVGDLGA